MLAAAAPPTARGTERESVNVKPPRLGAARARTYGALLSLFDAGGACGAALSAALARHVVYGVWEHVPRLVMVCSALAVGPLGLLFLV